MRNRTKSAEPAPLREPLLAALDVEYAHASKAKNLERMAEITKVVDALNGLWPGSPAPAVAPAQPAPPAPPAAPDLPVVDGFVPIGPAYDWSPQQPEPEQEAIGLPAAPAEMSGLSMRDILHRADPAPPVATGNGQGERRRAAREAVRAAVADVNRRTDAEHYKYELSLMVVNQNIEAMSDLKDAAAAAGLPVAEYAKRTIAAHNARRRRAARIYAVEERALKDIDTATGDAIDAIAARAAQDIRGDDA